MNTNGPSKDTPMMKPRVPRRPGFLEEIQDRWRQTSHGSEPGRWSAEKAALSVREYEARGGRWDDIEDVPQGVDG